MDKIKAPGTLSYRDKKAAIEAEENAAKAFGDHMMSEVVKDLKLTAIGNKWAIEDPEGYIDRAAEKIHKNIRYVVEFDDRNWYGKSDAEKPRWMHVWRVPGSKRSAWSYTDMVIRKNGTVNTEYLSRKLWDMVWNDYYDDRRANVRAFAQEQLSAQLGKQILPSSASGRYVMPGGYNIELTGQPPADGDYFVLVSKDSYGSEALREAVRIRNVPALIEAHQAWSAALHELRG